jgi:ABC-type sulfate/molybdate transport systems ATPase subunit
MIERFQLADSAALRPKEASPAQRLRCAVARALIAVPKLLLIDERAFDIPLFQQVRAAFAGPILLVTGDLDLCCAAVEEVIVLATGPHLSKLRACWESPISSRPPSPRSIPRAIAAAWSSPNSP